MFADEKRQVLLMVGAGVSVLLLITAAVLLLDVRSVVQTNMPQVEAAINDAVQDAIPVSYPAVDEYGNPIFDDEFTLPRGVEMRGSLQRGQTVSGSMGMYHDGGV